MTATDKATEVVADVAEEFGEQALEFADVSRGTDSRRLALAFGAFLLGTGVGGGVAFLLTKRRLETKYSQIADEEISEMREHFAAKVRATEAAAAKRPVEEIVRERGYSSPDEPTTSPPMAVPPPSSVKEDEEETPEPKTRNIWEEHGDQVEFEWDWHKERSGRSPDIPYVIHYDEREEMDGYDIHTLTYYEGDDVVCNERDEIIDPDKRNDLIGEKNLMRFGHGSGDPAVVYVRNDQLELVYEVVRSPQSYSEEVHGIKHESFEMGNLQRMRKRERDDAEG